MRYMLLHAVDESRLSDLPPQVETELAAWVDEMVGRGVELDGARLHSTADATTVRVRDGQVEVTDGPFAETKEQIAGYDVLECADLDTAIAVASAHPTLHVGAIEVRPFDEGMPAPDVPDDVAEGKRRYLMLVCADMRRAMSEEDADEAPASPDVQLGDDGPMDIDDWCDSVADRRLYGWALEHPDQAVTVRRVDGRIVTTDGPFAETKEQVAGYDLLECHDLDEALAAARTHPVAHGGVLEVRPVFA
ncbi:MAG: YciI family protein [Nocardioides sp.]